jgi:hypothetical protein
MLSVVRASLSRDAHSYPDGSPCVALPSQWRPAIASLLLCLHCVALDQFRGERELATNIDATWAAILYSLQIADVTESG